MNQAVPSTVSSESHTRSVTDGQASPPFPLPPEYSQIYDQLRAGDSHDSLRDFRDFLQHTRLEDELHAQPAQASSRSSLSQHVRTTAHVADLQNDQRSKSSFFASDDLDCLRAVFPAVRVLPRPVMNRYFEVATRVVLSRFQFSVIPDSTTTPAILLSLLSLGAQALFEERTAVSLHDASVAALSGELHQSERWTTTSIPNDSARGNPSDLLRALLLVNEFIQLQQGENLVQDTNAVRAHTLSHLSRSTIMLGRTTQTYGSTICDVEATSCGAERQIKTYVFCMLCLQTLLVGTEVTVAVDSSQVLLARCVSNCTWSRFSDDADETRCRCPEVPTLYEALRILGNSTTSPNDLPWLRNATNIYIIVIHILYSSHMLTQLRQSMVLDPRIVLQDTTKPFIAAVNQCSLALQDLRVVSDRDCVKTASLSNVDALVSLVRLRQVFDLDILSILRLKDPLQSAELALSFPGPQRSLQLIPTLERCATIMETPAKMGIMLYARTQLNLWSLEQTLATFECTLFLSKWLEIFSLSLDESPATPLEARIYEQVYKQIQLVNLDVEDLTDGRLTKASTALLSATVVQVLEQMFGYHTNKPLTQKLSRILDRYILLKKSRGI